MLKLSDSEVILASMTPEEAREYNQGNKENTLIYRAAKAKAKRFLEEEKEKKLKVAKKIPVIPPKPDMVNGHSDWNSDDWMHSIDPAWWLPDEPDKSSGILEQDLANEYWQEQYENYLNNGGTLDFKQFMQQELNKKVSQKINKIAEEKRQTEGLAAILGVSSGRTT